MRLVRIVVAVMVLGFMLGGAGQAYAQEEEAAERPWVYASFYKVPWERVDSLTALNKLYPWVEKAVEMGHILGFKMLVHHTGDEYNIVLMTFFPSWEAIGEGARWSEVFEALEPDAERRAEVDDGFDWVFQGTKHYDIIYRVMETP
ncbi:MAG: hypothetical protein GTO05_07660 [Gemmatimonadales bacterium]|nr:hypothetical protein [Gemmatimonadales bacterium]